MPLRDFFLVLLICLAWAGNFLTSKLALLEFPPLLFTALRLILLAMLLVAFLRLPPKGQWPRLVAVALCNAVLHFGLSFWSLKLSSTLASPAILMQSYVPMATLEHSSISSVRKTSDTVQTTSARRNARAAGCLRATRVQYHTLRRCAMLRVDRACGVSCGRSGG